MHFSKVNSALKFKLTLFVIIINFNDPINIKKCQNVCEGNDNGLVKWNNSHAMSTIKKAYNVYKSVTHEYIKEYKEGNLCLRSLRFITSTTSTLRSSNVHKQDGNRQPHLFLVLWHGKRSPLNNVWRSGPVTSIIVITSSPK